MAKLRIFFELVTFLCSVGLFKHVAKISGIWCIFVAKIKDKEYAAADMVGAADAALMDLEIMALAAEGTTRQSLTGTYRQRHGRTFKNHQDRWSRSSQGEGIL